METQNCNGRELLICVMNQKICCKNISKWKKLFMQIPKYHAKCNQTNVDVTSFNELKGAFAI